MLSSSRNLFFLFWLALWSSSVEAVTKKRSKWNQTAGYSAGVDFTTWSNFDTVNGGCVTCPYTCVKPTIGPNGQALNFSNSTLMSSLPSIYNVPKMNGCCYARKGQSKQQPDCSNEANPTTAEDCGFLQGPALTWDIQAPVPPKDSLKGILFASIDCESFWAVGTTPVRMSSSKTTTRVKGSKVINGGCWGDPKGVAIVVLGCVTQQLKFDKSQSYRWDQLAQKCMGLGGKCTRTNSLFSRNLKCCMNSASLQADWDKSYKIYNKSSSNPYILSGPAIVGIVFGGVAFLMCLVHYGAKIRERARQTALLREQEATEDYDEIVTPLVNGSNKTHGTNDPNGNPVAGMSASIGPASIELSLEGADELYNMKKDPEDEVLMEGDLY